MTDESRKRLMCGRCCEIGNVVPGNEGHGFHVVAKCVDTYTGKRRKDWQCQTYRCTTEGRAIQAWEQMWEEA